MGYLVFCIRKECMDIKTQIDLKETSEFPSNKGRD